MSKTQGPYVMLVVQDNGIGMQQEQKGKVFDIFQRLHEEVEGSGVGLNIVKQIVENYEGRIELETEAGKGSTFTIYLPEEKINGACQEKANAISQ